MMNKWSAYSKDDKFLMPLMWIGGNQKDSMIKILKCFKDDKESEKQKTILFDSKCGSGKSLVLLNTINNVGRGIIIVPSLLLQDQYNIDYSGEDSIHVKKDDGTKLKIGTMFGRRNFTCKYLENAVDKDQTVLEDGLIIYDKLDITCAVKGLPCNKTLSKGENRISVGSKCKYFIPAPRSKDVIDLWNRPISDENIGDDSTYLDVYKQMLNCSDVKFYTGVDKNEYGLFIRDDLDSICPYYRQFYNHLEEYCDVIVYNKWKWEIETSFGRKPLVGIECIDEMDEFLNGLNQSIILSSYMVNSLYKIRKEEKDMTADEYRVYKLKTSLVIKFNELFKVIEIYKDQNKSDEDINKIAGEVIGLVTSFIDYVTDMQKDRKIVINDQDDEIAEMLYKLHIINKYLDKTLITTSKSAKNNSIHYNIPYPDLILEDLFKNSSKNILMCSGTMHGEFTLKHLYGLNFDEVIVGRQDQPGTLHLMRPKIDMVNVNYSNWMKEDFVNYYNDLLLYIVTKLNKKGKTLVLTPAKKYVETMISFLRAKNVNVHVDFRGYDVDDNNGAIGSEDKIGNEITVSYRMKRGIDLKGDECRVVVWTKYPLANISDGYIMSLFRRFDKNAWTILNDNADMDTIQGVCRGLRTNEDWCVFSTPDVRVYDVVERWWRKMQKIKDGNK